jgi:acyl carrier protein
MPPSDRKAVSVATSASEDEFVQQALQFLAEIGADITAVESDTHLFDSGALDSLGTLAFLDFLEQQAGEEIEVEKLDITEISTLRNAYRFVASLAPAA